MGTYSCSPTYIRLVVRQLARRSSSRLMFDLTLIANSVSPGCTTYFTQLVLGWHGVAVGVIKETAGVTVLVTLIVGVDVSTVVTTFVRVAVNEAVAGPWLTWASTGANGVSVGVSKGLISGVGIGASNPGAAAAGVGTIPLGLTIGAVTRNGKTRKRPIFVRPCAIVTPRMDFVRRVSSPQNKATLSTKTRSSALL